MQEGIATAALGIIAHVHSFKIGFAFADTDPDLNPKRGSDYIRLLEPPSGERGRYTTLSYSWVGTTYMTTTRETRSDHKQKNQVVELPKTFQYAITLARGLEYTLYGSMPYASSKTIKRLGERVHLHGKCMLRCTHHIPSNIQPSTARWLFLQA